MSRHISTSNSTSNTSDWLTIHEAVRIMKQLSQEKISESDIYRNALHGKISLSIYFQSPIILKKIRMAGHKLKLKPIENSFIKRLCLLDEMCFIEGRNLIVSSEDDFIIYSNKIIDTTLLGYEYIVVQRLLARALNIPLPIPGATFANYGISVCLSGELFQVFEHSSWQDRIVQKIRKLDRTLASDIYGKMSLKDDKSYRQKSYFPLHDLPHDACIVIRCAELEKLITTSVRSKATPPTETRISTPLSRLFWLSCKHNEAISPLIRHPYKLLSIFEQWACTDGITDRLSGDTLKTALERGSPTTISVSN